MKHALSLRRPVPASGSPLRRSAVFCWLILAGVQMLSAQVDSLFVGAMGDVGVGTDSPTEALHVNRTGASTRVLIESDDSNATFRMKANNGRDWVGGLTSTSDEFRLTSVGSGVTEMIVEGGTGDVIIAGTLTTNSSFLPDYVFEEDYPLMPLEELGSFIEKNGHLPAIPSASEVGQRGGSINLSDMQMRLLEKVEELTLYTLQQERRLVTLEKENTELRRHLSSLEDR